MQSFTVIGSKKKIKDKARIVSKVFSLLHSYIGEIFIIKYSGESLNNPELADAFASDVIALKRMGIKVIIIHGGGSKAATMLDKFEIKNFYQNCSSRLVNQPTIEFIEMVLSGYINKQIVSTINRMGGSAIGISGKDGGLIEAKRMRRLRSNPRSNIEKLLDVSFMGEISVINPEILLSLEEADVIPVISPIAIGEQGETFQVSSDEAAGAIAASLTASKLIIMTDYPGIVCDGQVQKKLSLANLEKIIKDNQFDTDLYNKINICINALKYQTDSAHIIDGRIPHSLLLEIFTEESLGTMIYI